MTMDVERQGSPLLLCVHCRRLVERPAAAGYRLAPDDPGQCPSCGEPGLVDPRQSNTATALQAMDDEEQVARRSQGSRLAVRGATVVGMTLGAAIAMTLLVALYFGVGRGHQVFSVLALMAGVLTLVPVGLVGLRATSRLWSSTRPLPRPARWALTAASPRLHGIARGPAECDVPLTAPLTGRPCVAYEVGVREDTDVDGALGTWLLLEQRCADLSVGGHAVVGSKAALVIRREPYASEGRDDKLRHLLTVRGLATGQTSPFVYESVVHPGATVDLLHDDAGVVVIRAERG